MVEKEETMFTVERTSTGVAVIRLDRPPGNSLPTWGLGELEALALGLRADPPGAVVVWGGPEVFSTGGDPGEFVHFNGHVGTYVSQRFHGAFDAVAAIPCPTIAAIAGIAAGGGLEMALACDFRIAGSAAQMGQREITLGLFPGGGGTQRLPRLVGSSNAKEIIFSGDLLDAHRAYEIGLVNRVVEDDRVLGDAMAWAESLATGATSSRQLAKQAVDEGLELTLVEGLAVESRLFANLFSV